jgi:hypothetical protein
MYLAYLDAGTGSMIAQAMVAGVAGVAVAGRVGWHRVTSLRKKRGTDETPVTVDEEQRDAQ